MKFGMISVKELRACIDTEGIIIIDLREKSEYYRGHIKGAIHVNSDNLEYELQRLMKSGKKINKIVLYCERGNSSIMAARDMARLGFPVVSLQGGYISWRSVNRV